jgi:hypothetical protein
MRGAKHFSVVATDAVGNKTPAQRG